MSDADFTIVFTPSFQSTGKVLSNTDLGVGFDVARMQTQKRKLLTGDVREQRNEFSVQQYQKIERLSDITEGMDVGGALEVSYGLISGSGEGSAFEKSVTNQRTITIMYMARHQKSYSEIQDPVLSGDAGSIRDVSKFTEKYDTHYVGRIVYGASLSITASLTFKTKEEADELKAEIEGSIGVGKLSLKVKAFYERRHQSMETSYSFSCNAKSYGLNISEPQPQSIDGIDTYIKKWEEERAKRFSSGDFTSMPVAATIMVSKPWVSLFDLNDAEMSKMMENVRESKKMMLESIFDFASVWNVEEYLKQKYNTPRDRERMIRPWREQKNAWKKQRDEHYSNVLTYLTQPVRHIVHNPPPSFPSVTLATFQAIVGQSYIPISNKYYYEGFQLHKDGNNMLFLEGKVMLETERSCVQSFDYLEATSPRSLLDRLDKHPGFFCGTEYFDFSEGKYKGSRTAVVKFPMHFEREPTAAVFFSRIDSVTGKNMRIDCKVIYKSKEAMMIECLTWSDTELWIVGVSWFVCDPSLGTTGVKSFSFLGPRPEMILREQSRELATGNGHSAAAISRIDFGCQANARLNVQLSRHGPSVDVRMRTWADSIVYSSNATWLSLSETIQIGRVDFKFDGSNGERKQRKYIKFPRSFNRSPNVNAGLYQIDFDKETNSRVDVRIEEGTVSATGMYVLATTWSDTRLWTIGIIWVAGPSSA